MYENLERLFEVEVDGTEVQVVWKHSGEVFLQLDTERALERDPAEKELYWILRHYPDLVAERLASWVSDLFDCE